jgi:hypothetical protein
LRRNSSNISRLFLPQGRPETNLRSAYRTECLSECCCTAVGDAWAFDVDRKAQPRRAPGVQRWQVDVEFESLSDLRSVDLPSWQAGRRRGERRMTIDELPQRHGVAVAALVDAAVALGRSGKTTEPLSAGGVYVIEARLGLDRH